MKIHYKVGQGQVYRSDKAHERTMDEPLLAHPTVSVFGIPTYKLVKHFLTFGIFISK